MFNYAKQLECNQREPLPGQVQNSAGGFSFPVDDWTRLDRFLILGSEGGSYYATPRALTRENAAAVERCLTIDGVRVVNRIIEISDVGRAPKNDPALFALALAAKTGNPDTRAAALTALPKVARIGTHLFHFAEAVKALGGWGRGTKRAFADWYRKMPDGRLVLQAIKYQQRDGWSHRDLLRKSHPIPLSDRQRVIFQWITRGWEEVGDSPHPDEFLARIWAFERAKTCSRKELVRFITDYGLPHECVPNESKDDPDVWTAMLPQMGLTALVRNLGKMTSIELIAPMSRAAKLVCERLEDVDEIRKARLHPLQILVALRTYLQGHGGKGSLAWRPERRVSDALDAAFYLAFKAIEPTGKRYLLGIDVSGSMNSHLSGLPISAREGACAMAMITAATEAEHHFFGFSAKFVPLLISPRQRLDDVCDYTRPLPSNRTDCALPMLYAIQHKIPVDVFCVYTDSETWFGNVHPTQALRAYRQKMGIPAKLVVCGMISNGFTIADPNDAGQMDVVGFDTVTPSVISDFAR